MIIIRAKKISDILMQMILRKKLVFLIILLFTATGGMPLLYSQAGTGSISGRVTDETGAGLQNVVVRATISALKEGVHQRKWANTDANGNYQIVGLEPETYIVRTINELNYVDEYYNDARSRQTASVVKVNDGSEVTGIDFVLGSGGFIAGTITDALTGEILPNIEVYFYDVFYKDVNGIVRTDSLGRYQSPALKADYYFIRAFGVDQGFIPVYWTALAETKKFGDSVLVVQGEVNPDKNFRLQKGGEITGFVYDEETRAGIQPVWIVVQDSNQEWASQAWTDQNGFYRAGGLKMGAYKVYTYEVDPWKYRPEYFENSDNFNLANWVNVESSSITPNIDFYLGPVKTRILRNEYIEFAVTDKFPGTNLTLGTTGGLESPADDSLSLLNGHPRPVMSYTTIRIDDKNFRFGSKEGHSVLPPTIVADNKSIIRSWQINNIVIQQKVAFVPSVWANPPREDTAILEYLIVNQDNMAHQIGARILFDTKLGLTDGAPIDLPYYGASEFEREFTLPKMPPWWTAKNNDNGETVFSAQGTLRDYGATTPDRLVIARYSEISKGLWDFQPVLDERYTSDSAVGMWWYPVEIAPGDTLKIVTYYGLGSDTPDTKPPEIIKYVPERFQQQVHPDSQIYFIVKDLESGVDIDSLTILINGKPARIQTEGSIRELTVLCYPAEKLHYNQLVSVSISGLKDFAPEPNIRPAEEYNFTTIEDTLPPKVIRIKPEYAAQGVPVNTAIEIWLVDSSGIDTSSLVLNIEGKIIQPKIVGNSQALHLSYTPLASFPYSQKIDISLIVKDISFPPNELEFTSYFFTMQPEVSDSLAPRIINLIPIQGDTMVSRRPTIQFEIKDDDTGINIDSLKVWVNQQRIQPDTIENLNVENFKHFRIRYTPDEAFDFGEKVGVLIQIEDLAPIPNKMHPFLWQFKILRDWEPPFVSDQYPAPNALNIPPNTKIQFFVRDQLAGVDLNSVELYVDSLKQVYQASGDSSAYKIVSYPILPWDQSKKVRIWVEASDLYRPANVMKRVSWQFTTTPRVDSIPPYTTDHFPARGAHNVTPGLPVMLRIKDDLSGVDKFSIQMKINKQLVSPAISGNEKDYQLIYQPTPAFKYNETVEIIIEARDQAENVMPPDSYTISMIMDSRPPEVTDLNPRPDENNVLPEIQPSFWLRDNLSGVDVNSIRVLINTVEAQLSLQVQDSLNVLVKCQPQAELAMGEKVDIVIEASDLVGNRIPPKQYSFYTTNKLPDLQIVSFSTVPANKLTMNVPFFLVAEVKSQNVKVNKPFETTFYEFNQFIGDTLIQELSADSAIILKQLCSYPAGKYQFKIILDSKDKIIESYEINNIAELIVEIEEGVGRVSPNPFTPNGDGFNDQVKFDFTQLKLNHPELKIFSFEGMLLVSFQKENEAIFYWNGTDKSGNQLKPGIYLYILTDADKIVAKGQIILAR